MANLFETIKKQMDKRKPADVQPAQSQIAGVLAAKGGKAGAGTGAPKASSLGEGAAIGEAQAAAGAGAAKSDQIATGLLQAANNLKTQQKAAQQALASQNTNVQTQLATAGTAQRAQTSANEANALARTQAAETQTVERINNAASMQLKKLASEKQTNLNGMLDEFEHSNRELEFRKDSVELEQIGFLLAMRDQAYVDEIKRIGEERNLRSDLEFQKEMGDLVWGEELQRMMESLGFKSLTAAKDRDLKIELAGIDATTAMQMADALIKQANTQAIAEGGTTILKEGWDYYGKDKPAEPAKGGGSSNMNPNSMLPGGGN